MDRPSAPAAPVGARSARLRDAKNARGGRGGSAVGAPVTWMNAAAQDNRQGLKQRHQEAPTPLGIAAKMTPPRKKVEAEAAGAEPPAATLDDSAEDDAAPLGLGGLGNDIAPISAETEPLPPVTVRPGDAGRLPGFTTLPQDITSLIFLALFASADARTLARVRLTCRAWRTYVSTLPLVVPLPRRGRLSVALLAALITKHFPRLTGLSGVTDVVAPAPFSAVCSQIKSLSVRCNKFSNMQCWFLFGKVVSVPNLTTLSVALDSRKAWNYLSPGSLYALTNLTSLSLTDHQPRPLSATWQLPTTLQVLALTKHMIADTRLPNLRSLSLSEVNVRYEVLHSLLAHLPALREVTFRALRANPGAEAVVCDSVESVTLIDSHWTLAHIAQHFPNVRALTVTLPPTLEPPVSLSKLEAIALPGEYAPTRWITHNIECLPSLRRVSADAGPLAALQDSLTKFRIAHLKLTCL